MSFYITFTMLSIKYPVLFFSELEAVRMSNTITYKVVDYVEHDLDWEEEECRKLGVNFEAYQLKFANPSEIIEKCGDSDFLVVDMAPMTREALEGLESLKVLIRHGIGYDKVDIPACTDLGICFANQPAAFIAGVAEHACMLILATYRKLFMQNIFFNNSVKSGNWEYHEIYPVSRFSGKTIGIIGCGNIGSKVIDMLSGFGFTFLICDPYKPEEKLTRCGFRHTPLDEVLAKSDIVSLHVPVTEETRGFINYDKLKLMKRDAVLVNTARGQVVNTGDLIRALKEELIMGAGLDVHEGEPPPEKYGFLDMDNVICTPHFGWYSEEGAWEIREEIMNDFKRFLDGQPPKYILNPEVLESPQLRMK